MSEVFMPGPHEIIDKPAEELLPGGQHPPDLATDNRPMGPRYEYAVTSGGESHTATTLDDAVGVAMRLLAPGVVGTHVSIVVMSESP